MMSSAIKRLLSKHMSDKMMKKILYEQRLSIMSSYLSYHHKFDPPIAYSIQLIPPIRSHAQAISKILGNDLQKQAPKQYKWTKVPSSE